MYPRITDLLKDFLGIDFPLPIYSFGFMMAVAILTASWIAGRELQRLQKNGRLGKITQTVKDKAGKVQTIMVQPSDLMTNITVVAAIAGVIGAKVFYVLEEPNGTLAEKLFSAGGLTFYGGLIFGAIAVLYYVRKKGVQGASLPVFMDALAPSLILAYGIGRMGCHLAGDGDWGIAANMTLKPSFLPNWLWAETYPRNILGQVLDAPGVYPTPIWEFIAGVAIFGMLMLVRKHPFKSGWLFSLYLLLNGLERFLIEKVRVNTEYHLGSMVFTQAELIATIFMLAGIVGLVLLSKKTPVLATAA